MDQSVFTVLPPKASLRPGMVLAFELFLLRGSVLNTDHVVAWGVFPICDGQFDIIEGKYKCPMLCGPMDMDMDKHEKIEELMASDLDHWLCNLYFEVVKLPRYYAGQKVYEVELQFSSGLTSHPDRLKTGWEDNCDGEDPVPGSSSDLSSEFGASQGVSQVSLTSAGDSGHVSHRSILSTRSGDAKKGKFLGTTILSRVIHRDSRKLKFDESSDEEGKDSQADPQDIYAIRKERDFRSVPGMDGMFYKKYLNNPADAYYKRMFTMLPRTRLLAPEKKQRKLTHLEQLEQHSFCVQPPFSGKGRLAQKGREKMNYVARQFLAELGLSQWRSREFWGMMLMLLIVFWLRMYLHYIGQWLFLSAIRIPINKFNFLHQVQLPPPHGGAELPADAAPDAGGDRGGHPGPADEHRGLLPAGGLRLDLPQGLRPHPRHRLQVRHGLRDHDLLRPFADPAHGLRSDALRRHVRGPHRRLCQAVLALLPRPGLWCGWHLHHPLPVHLHGLHDLLHPLHVLPQLDEDVWDMAYGGEVSEHERQGVKERLRKEITTHVSIHTLHLDGLRDLHRHFLRLPDGAVVEVFGDISVPGMDKDIKKALERGSHDLPNVSASGAQRKVSLETPMTS